MGTHTGYWTGFFVPSVLGALGLGLCFTPIVFAATAGIPPREVGLASGIVNTSRQIGGATGLAALATIATTRTDDVLHAGGRLVNALALGYSEAFRVSASIALLATVAALLVPRKASAARPGTTVPDGTPGTAPVVAGAVPVVAPGASA